MAIDNIPYRDADNFAYPDKRFWPLRIPVSHWQLRHFISQPEPDHLYYASRHEVFCIDTTTQKRRLIARLPFDARCTASGYGWVCVGGEEEGHFAAIKLDGSGPRSLDVDAALPIDAWRGSRRSPSVKIERIGEEIVNSISIHRVQDEEAHLDDIVAVLTNNDRTVRVYSLPQNVETTVLRLPFAMNHATISPDGSIMVAVGDYNQAYFFARAIRESPPLIPKPHNRLTSASIDWLLMGISELHVSSPDSTLGYFTTAWSPNGQLCAVGSEEGYITVFDVDILSHREDGDDEDPVVAVVPSSRADLPMPYVGAVRTMIFSPEPWDLLIWAEDQGRVCIGDLRTGLKSKQVLNLEPKEEGLKTVDVEHAVNELTREADAEHLLQASRRNLEELEADVLQRYRSVQDNATAVNFATEYIEARRRQRQQRQADAPARSRNGATGGMDDEPQGLTVREQQILESLRTTRQREEARSAGQARGMNYTTSDMFGPTNRSSASSTPNTVDSSARPISDILTSVQESLPELARTTAISSRPPSTARDPDDFTLPPLSVFGDAHTWGGSRASALPTSTSTDTATAAAAATTQSRLPRRRASVVLTPPTSQPSQTSAANNTAQASRHDQLTPTATTDEREDDDNPWRTIEDAMAFARGPLFESAARAPSASPLPAPPRPSDADVTAEQMAQRVSRARSQARRREHLRQQMTAATSVAGTSSSAAAAAPTIPVLTIPVLSMDQTRRVQGFPEGYDALLRRRMASYGREMGVRTAGLAMSRDGSTLWAACEEGIFEFKMNRKGRMIWPAIDVR